MIKNTVRRTLCVWLVAAMPLVPVSAHAVPIEFAILILSKALDSSATGGASATVTFPAEIGTAGQFFSGEARASANVGTRGNARSSAEAMASMDLQFLALKRARYFIQWNASQLVTTSSRRFADGSALSVVSALPLVESQRFVSVNTTVGSDYKRAAAALVGTTYLGRLPADTMFGLSVDNVFARARASSGVFSRANSSATSGFSFTVYAIPEPGIFVLFGIGFAALVVTRRRRTPVA